MQQCLGDADLTAVAIKRGSPRWLAALLMAVLLALPASVAGLMLVRSPGQREAAMRFDSQLTTASRFIQSYVDQAVAQEFRLARAALTGPLPSARFDQIIRATQYSTAVVLDVRGRVLAISPADPSVLGQRVDAQVPAFRAAEDGAPAATNVVWPGNGRAPVIGFAVPFNTPTGRRVFAGGYTIVDTPLQPFVVSALSTFHTAHAYLLDATGVVISTDRKEQIGQPLSRAAGPLAEAISRHSSGYLGHNKQRQYYVTGGIEGTHWRLVYTIDTTEMFVSLAPVPTWWPWATLAGFVLMGLGILALFGRALAGRRQAEAEHARQESILDTASDAFIGMNECGLVTDWNTAAVRLLGWTKPEALGHPVTMLMVPPKDRSAHVAGFKDFLDTGLARLPSDPISLIAQHRDGHEIPIELTVSRTRWQGGWQFHAFLRDISERLAREHQLQELALTDSLTGLTNRRAFVVNLDQAHARACRHQTELIVLYADIDGFKSINDTYGHTAGDAVLVQVAGRLRAQFRAEDTIGRLGGDEFAVICEDFAGNPQNLVRRLHEALANPYVFRDRVVKASVSVGLASRREDESVEHLLERADMTMYQAKAGHGSEV